MLHALHWHTEDLRERGVSTSVNCCSRCVLAALSRVIFWAMLQAKLEQQVARPEDGKKRYFTCMRIHQTRWFKSFWKRTV